MVVTQSWGQITDESAKPEAQVGLERRNRAWARLTSAAARGDAPAWRHLVTVHATPLWHFALDCGLTPDAAEQACELAWMRAAQLLEERPHVGRAFGHTLRGVVVDEAHRARDDRDLPEHRPRLGLVSNGRPVGAEKRSGARRSEQAGATAPPEGEKRAADRRRPTRGAGGDVSPPYFDAFERIANALEGIEDALRESGILTDVADPGWVPDTGGQYPEEPRRTEQPIVLPGSPVLGSNHPRP